MDDRPDIIGFSVLRCGGVARRNLVDGHEGGVAAVFRSSFYLEAGGDFACVGSETVGLSPLNVVSDAPGDTDWSASGLRVGARWRVCAETVHVGNRFSFDLDDAEDWKPQPVPADWRAADLRRGLEALRHRATGRVPRDGLGFLILSGPSKPAGQTNGKTAETHAMGLRQWLADAIRGRHAAACDGSRWIHPLIGLGPGLTPAGDDFIGGIMIALHGLGHEDSLRRLWAAARPSAVAAGNPISLAHLSAASEGMGSAAVHRTLTATLTARPEGIDRQLDAIDRIGHTSGWDTLAGVVLALDAWIVAHDRGRLGRVARSTRESQGGVSGHDNAMTGEWRVGVDIGGTFTDVVAYHPGTREVRTAKVCSGAGDPVAGLLTAAFAAIGMTWDEIAELVHGTTIVTNAIVEERLSDVALVATEGFADTLAIGRQNRRHLYRLDVPPKAPPQVPEERRLEVPERLDANGAVIEDLTDEAIETVVQRIAASGVEAVAVALLHAYANPAHEEKLGERLREAVPHVALSHRVNPEAREYERTATTVLSAGVMPLATRYLGRLKSEKPKNSRLHLFHSAGGMASPEALGELPLGLVMSGPAAGVVAASRVARDLGIDNAISFDMGGTTTDVCLITDGQAHIRSDRSLGTRPLRQPMVAVETIGAGGGSIARLDTGALRVGPDSAGASPGPACYGRGGAAPTVSDANMVLGCLESGRTLGDGIVLDGRAARRALAPLAAEIGTDEVEVSRGIVRVANAAMARALRKVTVERGIDGRGCTLLAFGGAGPMHAVDVARTFGIRRVVVPRFSGGFSALGCISAELSYSQQQTVRMASGAWDRERLDRIRDTLFSQLSAPLAAAGHGAGELVVESVAAIRYRGQSYAVDVPSPDLDDPDRLGRAFRALHETLYGFETNEPWELVGLRLRVSAPREAGVDSVAAMAAEPAGPGASSLCSFGPEGPVETFRHAREALAEGQRIEGPAIVEDDWSTVVVPPRATLRPDAAGHLIVDVETAP